MSTPAGGLRRMRWFDIAPVAALDAQVFGPDAWSVEYYWSELAASGRMFWVAEEGGRLLGYAGLGMSGPQADVLTIATAPAARGTGLGGRLLDTLIDHARSAGAEAVYLDVRSDNEVAISLYERRGFDILGRRAGYYTGADALIMRVLIA